MIKLFLALLVLVAVGSTGAEAKTMKLPDAKSPVATVDIPDGWNPEEMEDGATGANDDATIYVTASDKKKDAEADVADSISLLNGVGVKPDQASKKTRKIKINGLDAEEVHFQGKETLGSHINQVSIIVVRAEIKDKVIVLATSFPSTDEKTEGEVERIIQSLKPTATNASADGAKGPANAEGAELSAPQKPENLIGQWKSTGADGAVMPAKLGEI